MTTTDEDSTHWHRLDPKSVIAFGTVVVAPMPPSLAVMAITGASLTAVLTTAAVWLGCGILLAVLNGANWYLTRFRLSAQRFELRTGLLSRSRRSIPRDRIRSVDLTAKPVHRVFGLSVVVIGTGQQQGEEAPITLDAVTTGYAERLHEELLGQSTSDTKVVVEGEELARIRPRWFGYGALTVSLAAVVWGALASALGSGYDLLSKFGVYELAASRFLTMPLWAQIALPAVGLLVSGCVGAVLLSTEMWWGFRLIREQGALRVRRGLITTRSMSLEEVRLRGAEITEPLLLRWAGGARLKAIATGLKNPGSATESDSAALLPPAPVAEVRRVTEAVLRTSPDPTRVPLRRHPRAALRRRLTWATGTALIVVGMVAVATWMLALPWEHAVAVTAATGLPATAIAVFTGVDSYRNLGHASADGYLVARNGSALRRTAAVEHGGIIGWRIRQSFFQRRAGLITVTATSAAGRGAYPVHDVAVTDGLDLARAAVPGLLDPFLVSETARPGRAARDDF